jgi:flavin reductase (DIM6/NTAB) family NADH-FMN oxidoreductase RutF
LDLARCGYKPAVSEPLDAFGKIVAGLDYPMLVVTTAAGEQRAGCLVGFSTQCSIDPARYAVCISTKNHTAHVVARADTVVVHVLRPGDEERARLFGEETGDEISKFDRCEWHAGPAGTPVLEASDWFAGRIVERVDAGDHVMLVLDVLDGGRGEAAREGQLGFQALPDMQPGHSP